MSSLSSVKLREVPNHQPFALRKTGKDSSYDSDVREGSSSSRGTDGDDLKRRARGRERERGESV